MTNSWVNLDYFEWDSSGMGKSKSVYSEWVFIPEITKDTTFWDLAINLEWEVTPGCYGTVYYTYLDPKTIQVRLRPQTSTWMVCATFLPEGSFRVALGSPSEVLPSVLPSVDTLRRFGISYDGFITR